MLLIINPAAASTTTASATSTATSTLRAVVNPGVLPRSPAFFSDEPDVVRDRPTIGARLNNTPAAPAMAHVKASTAGSSGAGPASRNGASRIAAGSESASAIVPAQATPTPAAAPAPASSTPSASTCDARRAAACAEGRANREFAAPRRGLREQQVRHVDACNQQHESDRAGQGQQGRAQFGHAEVVHPGDRCRFTAIVVGVLFCEPGANRLHLGPGRFERHAVPQPRGGVERVRSALAVLLAEGDRHPNVVRTPGEHERRRHDADDLERLPAQTHRVPGDPGVGRVAPSPQPVADHDDVVPRRILGRSESPPELGRRAACGRRSPIRGGREPAPARRRLRY